MKLAFITPDPNIHIWETLCCLIFPCLCRLQYHTSQSPSPCILLAETVEEEGPISVTYFKSRTGTAAPTLCSLQETGRGLCWVGRAIAAGSRVPLGIGKEWPLLCNSLLAVTTCGKEWFIDMLSVHAECTAFPTSFCNRNVWAMSVLDPLTVLHNCFSIFNKFCWQTALRQQHNLLCNPDE